MTENESAAAAAATDSNTESPCCWLCLEEEEDDASDKPLIRDCSCRGSSGYAHLSCIIGWAENESKRGDTRNAFTACPNCKQPYQNRLRHDLSKARVKFAEREYNTMDNNAEGVAMHAGAIMNRMTLLDAEDQMDRNEGREICTKLHRIIEFTKTDNSRSWSQIVASGYMSIATFQLRMGMRFGYYAQWNDNSLHSAKQYYNLAMEIYKSEEDELSVSSIEKMIAIIDARLSGVERKVDKESDLNIERSKYKFYLDNLGRNHITTIHAGLLYSQTLFDLCYTVHAERLVTKLYGISQRAHGVEHNCTVDTFRWLQRVQERRVCVRSRPGETFQALRYVERNHDTDDDDNDDDQTQMTRLVLQGPIAIPRNVSKEQTIQQDSANVSYVNGTPVIFCLPHTPRLHDKVGSVIKCDNDETTNNNNNKTCYSIYFEEEKVVMRANKVEQQYLRIAFDLPDEDAK